LNVGLVVLGAAVDYGLRLALNDPAESWGSYAIMAGVFLAFPGGAVPQALLIRRAVAPKWRAARMIAWIVASAVGVYLYLTEGGYYDPKPPGWEALSGPIAPALVIIGFTMATAQSLALIRIVKWPLLILYIPVATIAFIVGNGLSLVYGRYETFVYNYIASFLWWLVPFLFVGIATGLVLAPSLSANAQRARAALFQR
jgi:hypothetical protein